MNNFDYCNSWSDEDKALTKRAFDIVKNITQFADQIKCDHVFFSFDLKYKKKDELSDHVINLIDKSAEEAVKHLEKVEDILYKYLNNNSEI